MMDRKFYPGVALLLIASCHVTQGQQHGDQATCWIPQGGYTTCRAPSTSYLSSFDPQQAMKYSVTITDLNMWSVVCCKARACNHLYSDKCESLVFISMGCGRTSFAKTFLWGPHSDVPEVQCKSSLRSVNIKVAFEPIGRNMGRHQERN